MTSWIVSEDLLAQGNVVIREATRGDVPRIVALYRTDELTRKHTAGASAEIEPGYFAAFDAIAADAAHNILLVAEVAGEVAGSFQLTFVPDMRPDGREAAIIENVIVAAGARGLGIGNRMMQWAIERARQRGCSQVKLTSNNRRADAHRFYERLGFEPSHVGFKIQL